MEIYCNFCGGIVPQQVKIAWKKLEEDPANVQQLRYNCPWCDHSADVYPRS